VPHILKKAAKGFGVLRQDRRADKQRYDANQRNGQRHETKKEAANQANPADNQVENAPQITGSLSPQRWCATAKIATLV
jgi:hypothetical protein